MPTKEEFENPSKFNIEDIDFNRIYKFVNSSGVTANFIPFRISSIIFDYNEKNKEDKKMMKELEKLSDCRMEIESPKKGMVYIKNEIGMTSRQNKNPNDIEDGNSIKERCWKLKTDRLGNIIEIVK